MRVYVINLDRSPDRLEHFQRQAAGGGVAFERISAVDGKRMSPQEIAAQSDPAYQFKPLSPAEVAVFLSHKQAWRQLLQTGEQYAAIFEDDVILAPNLATTLQAIERLPCSFDIIKLETTFRQIVVADVQAELAKGSQVQRLLTWHGGAAGYVISRACAERLLAWKERVSDPVDQVLFHPQSQVCSLLNVLQLLPAACVQNDNLSSVRGGQDFGSTIQQRHRNTFFRYGPLTDLCRLWNRFWDRRRRQRLAAHPGNQQLKVDFLDSLNSSMPTARRAA